MRFDGECMGFVWMLDGGGTWVAVFFVGQSWKSSAFMIPYVIWWFRGLSTWRDNVNKDRSSVTL